MKGPKEERERKTPDWLDQLVEEIYTHKQDGQKNLPDLPDGIPPQRNMRRERERSLYPGEQANSSYPRSLHLTLGKLKLKVPRNVWDQVLHLGSGLYFGYRRGAH